MTDIIKSRLAEIANNPYGDEEKRELALRLLATERELKRARGEVEYIQHGYNTLAKLTKDQAERLAEYEKAAREPVEYQARCKRDTNLQWTAWETCSTEFWDDCNGRDFEENGWEYQVRALYTTPQTAPVPDGYRLRLIPLEHTDAFHDACTAAFKEFERGTGPCGVFMAGHRAMLAAAPQPEGESRE